MAQMRTPTMTLKRDIQARISAAIENVLGNDVYDLEKGTTDVLDDLAVEDLSTAAGGERLSAGGLSISTPVFI